MNHQSSLLVRLEVVFTLVAGEAREKANVFFGKGPLPGKNVTNFHLFVQQILVLEPFRKGTCAPAEADKSAF